MTDELDLEANNLCIPEDAFEKFQAVSMYQEKEYIIMPQSIPPTPKPPEPDINNTMSNVNEVVLSAENVTNSSVNITQIDDGLEEEPLNSSRVESSIDLKDETSLPNLAGTTLSSENTTVSQSDNNSDMVVSNSENINNQANTSLESSTLNSSVTPRKRGRKPKKRLVPAEEPVTTQKNIQNPDISSTPFSSDPETSDTGTNVRKRRGRPPKIRPMESNAIGTLSDKDLSSELSGSDNNRYDNVTVPRSSKGRRGRPPKSQQIPAELMLEASEQIPHTETVMLDEEVQNEQLSSSNDTSSKPKRRRMSTRAKSVNRNVDYIKIPDSNNKMLCDSISDNDDQDDICLSKLKSVPSQCDISKSAEESAADGDVKDISSESNEQTKKIKTRRGRPKKSNLMTLSQMAENSQPIGNTEVSETTQIIGQDGDDICLSELKTNMDDTPKNTIQDNALETKTSSVSEVEHNTSEVNGTPSKRNTKMPVMSDFEYNIDSVIATDITDVNNQYGDNSLLVEDTSKRPIRRKMRKLRYDEESDEDPFANMESSDDDEPRRKRRGNTYYSDDEYIPGKKGNAASESTDTEISENEIINLDDSKKQRRKKSRKKSDNQSPRKRGKKDDESKQGTVEQETDTKQNNADNDVEICLPTALQVDDESQPSQKWGASTEFENFLAKKIQGTSLKIKKVSSSIPTEQNKMEIPVIDQDAKKTIEMCTQTIHIPKTSIAVQTMSPYDMTIKETLPLTPEQSSKACYFLNGIVKTTAELGQLMTQKSEDFIKKKINTNHVTDTSKMDYCVKKSFLLFKLAKHNLQQMEDDLAKQYNDFLKSNNLTKCREEQKEVLPTPKDVNSDSDCEIVEVNSIPQPSTKTPQKSQSKPAFNPKTVFLNKELSIKIAKKPNDNKKLDIKGRHTVWINDTVMVKKVKPTQSFLAQDSRNKKPPDNRITKEMVSDFFKDYYRQRALTACAPFVSTDWLNVNKVCVCNYFVVKPLQFNAEASYSDADEFSITSNTSSTTVTEIRSSFSEVSTNSVVSTPECLFTLCYRILKIQLHHENLKEVTHKKRNTLTDGKHSPEPLTLFRLCMRSINDKLNTMDRLWATPAIHESTKTVTQVTALPLKTLCHRKIVDLLAESTNINTKGEKESTIDESYISEKSNDSSIKAILPETNTAKNGLKSLSLLCIEYFQQLQILNSKNGIKSLFSLCVEYIQKSQGNFESNSNNILEPHSLKKIAYENVKYLLYASDLLEDHDSTTVDGLLINCVNTLSEEAFLNLEPYNTDIPNSSEFLDDFDNEENDYQDNDYEPEFCDAEDDQTEPSWVSQVQMQELRSCVNLNSLDVNEHQDIVPMITQIKLEPLDEVTNSLPHSIPIKTENDAAPGLDEMTIIPDIKPEFEEHLPVAPIQRQNSNSYDVDVFEQFVSNNKLMQASVDPDAEEIYSQSSARVRRQHEPDYYEENNTDMLGLLVPHTYEPMTMQTAKGSLMESSSDESNKNPKNVTKKVVLKRGRGRGRKVDQKVNNKNVPVTPLVLTKEKEKPINEVAALTRKMKERIRQEEKNNESTDSESENVTVRLRSREKKDTADQSRDKSKPASRSKANGKNNEIQCNNVDSTDQLEVIDETFTGFTSIETNEMSNYEKYMKFVYDKVVPGKEEEAKIVENVIASKETNLEAVGEPIISPDEPVELLECEPTMPIFDENIREKPGPKKTKKKAAVYENLPFIERHGWQCYPVDSGDAKLYQSTQILLEKLPESFVQTYFEYQNVTTKDESDEQIKRLTNLNSLNRSSLLKEKKAQNTVKRDAKDKDGKSTNVSEDDSRTISAIESDNYDELMPSDDDAPKIDDEMPQPVQRQTENSLAKNLLMDDKESDEESSIKIKKEFGEDGNSTKKAKEERKKKKDAIEDTGDLMLTADKMMNKELTLLHAPVVMNDPVKDIPGKGPVTRHSKKNASKVSLQNNKTKNEEDSSSEEEKQWVSTKEKLLKRMGKKESASADDAKRAKLVTEFIERREGNPNSMKRRAGKTRRSGKKFLEREKQLRVLQRELFGEMSNDPTVSKRSVAAWKGRRNIRKVLDKKSLARSTVIANMEEFERKRRLNARQTKLRELLGCEEGVNVLVINDEVCLEYDFEEHRPVVTIHPFFTKVMKAHQYEGVKFMWDACFESLADMAAGHAGGGCILAHCMGLGKTLQVLALLHTVLTHPGVGMHRVLVCCPLSTVLNWVDEIHKWIGPVTNEIKQRKLKRKLQVFELSKLKKTYERAYQLEDWYNGGGIFIIGYELFRSLSTLDPLLDDIRPTIVNKIRTALLDPGPDIIVCDEGHLLKNDCSVLAVAMSRVVTKRRIVLTGTPMQNNLREYYCMVNFVKPNLLGTYAEYSNRFENPIMNGQHRDSSEEDIKLMKARTHILHKVLEGCLQRQEVSVLYPYLPKKHEYTVFITLTKCQWDLYKHYINHYSKQLKHNSILKDFHILQKIWSHPQVLHSFQTKARENKIKMEKLEDDLATEDQEDIKDGVATDLWWLQYLDGGNMLDSLETSNKFVVVFRILDECVALGDKVLIFSTSLFCLDALEYFLKKINKWSLGQEYYRLDGSVPAEVRQKWCREFNADNNVNTKLFLVSTRAGCLGLNMTAANRVIIMDTSWNPAHDIQSIFRVYRFGQKKDCFIYRLVAMGTMEQKIYERAVTKQAVACRVVDEQQIDRHYNMAELTELYRYDEAGSSVAGGVAVGVVDVALLRVARETALHAVHEHDSLLRSSEQGLPEHERAAAWMQFQQEQAHKQMENKLIANIPRIALKRVQGDNYTTSFELNDIKPEIKVEQNNDAILPSSETKTRRGKKVSKLIIPIPTQQVPPPITQTKSYQQFNPEEPSTSKSLRSQMSLKQHEEETMVHKISEILIKHGFQSNKKGSPEVAALVNKVRKVVKRGYITSNDGIDELTESIAKVLLPQKSVSLPVLSDIISESVSNSASTTNFEPENILSTPLNDYETYTNNSENKRKRKAALAAEKHIDSISQDVVINLDDEIDPSDTDFVPKTVEKSDKTNKKKNSLKDRASKETEKFAEVLQHTKKTEENPVLHKKPAILKPKPGPKTFKEKLQRKYKEITKTAFSESIVEAEDSRSILLSDDDDVAASNDVPASSEPAETRVDNGDDEVVPLPLSLLSNKNFINIVAHTYLNGNPMLDSDAATLAAQYSTFKSLKEAEQTGKDIVSGPIYDIAVKVIGKSLFKRMISTNTKASTSVDAAHVTIQLKEKMREMSEVTSSKKDSKSKAETNKASVSSDSDRDSTGNSQDCSSGDVVPVGLVQTRASMTSDVMYATSECILPDDDMHIVPHELPRPGPAPRHAPTRRATPADPAHSAVITPTATQKPPPVILNTMLSDSKVSASTPPKPSHRKFIKIDSGKIVKPIPAVNNSSQVSQTPAPAPAPQQILPTNDTICLDSDEEETITPTTSTAAHPVSLIPAATSTSIARDHPALVQAIPAVAGPTGQGTAKKIILRRVSPNSAHKFLRVPASKPELVPVPQLPKLLPKPPTPSTASSVSTPKEITKTQKSRQKTAAAPSTTEAKSPAPVPSKKIVQARCKPGDIIKISDTGEIEVLQASQVNTAALAKAPSVSHVSNSKTLSQTPKLKPSQTSKLKPPTDTAKPKPSSEPINLKPHTAIVNLASSTEPPRSKPRAQYSATTSNSLLIKKKAEKSRLLMPSRVSISSNSSISDPSSPIEESPMSIFKNVVRIQAVDETPGTPKEKSKSSAVKSSKSNSTNTYTRHTNPSTSTSTKAPMQAKESNIVTSKSSRSSFSDQSIIDLVTPKEKSNLVTIIDNITSKNSKILDDLKLKKSLTPTTDKKRIATSAKPIVIEKKNISSSNIAFTAANTTIFSTVKSGTAATMLQTKIEPKKRAAATETSAPKKKKTEPMTLKDFDIDDIDDIIELD